MKCSIQFLSTLINGATGGALIAILKMVDNWVFYNSPFLVEDGALYFFIATPITISLFFVLEMLDSLFT